MIQPMGTLRRGFGSILLIAAAAMLWASAPASAADTITAEVDCCAFAPGPYFQDLGEIPIFENPVGANPHNVTSNDTGPDGDALFRSDTIAGGDSSPVAGTQYLEAGTYSFFCTLHEGLMSGELVVEDGKGSVQPRPSVKVSIPSQKLRKVRRSGKLKVRVRAATPSSGISITVRRGKNEIASASRLKLKAGAARTVKLKLSRKARKLIAKGRKVSLSATGTVDFGKPSKARRSLR